MAFQEDAKLFGKYLEWTRDNVQTVVHIYMKILHRCKITKAEKLNSPGHSDHDKMIYTVTFSDGDTEDFNEGKIKPHLSIYGSELRSRTAASILGACDYIERRLTGDCASPYDCRHSYEICELAQLFDPSFAAEHEAEINAAYVQRLVAIIPIANLRPGRRRRRCCRRWWPGQ